MTVADQIRKKLSARFAPAKLEVFDESHLHKGHPGAGSGRESHFRIRIISRAFEGMSRVQRQRAISDALEEEFAGPLHALTMSALAPGEPGAG
jgi:BolA protein